MRRGFGALLMALICPLLLGLVDPSLQPSDILARYEHVFEATVSEVDFDANTLTLQVERSIQGGLPEREVVMAFPPPQQNEDGSWQVTLIDQIEAGETVVGFAGQTRRRGRGEQRWLLYARDQWQAGTLAEADDFTRWEWQEALGDAMWGTYNGQPARLAELLTDEASGRGYFPAKPLVQFAEPVALARLEAPIEAVALYDVNGDGRLDAVAAHAGQVHLYLQQGDGAFLDATEAWGLNGTGGGSLGLADVDGDGATDLLVDSRVLLQKDGRFGDAHPLPLPDDAPVHQASFVQLDGDGRPDVVLTTTDGRLHAFRQAGGGDAHFEDATVALGLADRVDAPAYFCAGDLNGDHRTDLFLAVPEGLILLQQPDGRFAEADDAPRFSLKTVNSLEPGKTGGGGMMPVWRQDGNDLMIAADSHLMLVTLDDDMPRDVTGYGNEIKVAGSQQLAVLPEDLNMDGHVDLYTLGRGERTPASFHANRGYGSFMRSELYLDYTAFPGDAHERGAGGAAAGDVTGNGANDLLIGGINGTLWLVPNECLSRREPTEHPLAQERVLQQTAYLTVDLHGQPGALGAEITVQREGDEQPTAYRQLGTQQLTGSQGPAQTTLALRQPGTYHVHARHADGRTWQREITLESSEHRTIRPEQLERTAR